MHSHARQSEHDNWSWMEQEFIPPAVKSQGEAAMAPTAVDQRAPQATTSPIVVQRQLRGERAGQRMPGG
jgi:hypothetical protein